MKRILKEYYSITIDTYKVEEKGITFFIAGDEYYLCQTKHSPSYIQYIYEITQKYSHVGLHSFVFNKEQKLMSEEYILFKLHTFVFPITIQDVHRFMVPVMEEKSYVPMEKFWEEKLDYMEEQVSSLSTCPLINNSFAYFLGIGEQIISKMRGSSYDGGLVLSHKVFSMSSLEFYNPLNITFDIYLRDYASYIRHTKEEEVLYKILDKSLSIYEKYYFFARLVFPFSYFREVEKILLDKNSEDKLTEILTNVDSYETYLSHMQTIFGYSIFVWIKKE